MTDGFYGVEQARIHDERFGDLARAAADHLLGLLSEAGLTAGTVIDLGCGSGILAERLIDAGYDVAGVDVSEAMVALARERAPGARVEVGDAHTLPLPDEVVAVTAVGEVLGYDGPAPGALEALARRAAASLVPGGVLLMDLAGPGRHGPDVTAQRFHRHRDWCLGMTATESVDGSSLVREITIFWPDGDGWRRVDERHDLRLFSPAVVLAALGAAGLEVAVLDSYGTATSSTPPRGWHVYQARRS